LRFPRVPYFLLGFLFWAGAPAQSQVLTTPVTPSIPATTPVPSPDNSTTLSAPPVPAAPATTYQFNSDTVWAHLHAEVKPADNGFSIEVQSSSPLSGWILKNPTGNHILGKGGCKPTTSVQFQVAHVFEPGDLLTLFVNVDNEQMPAILHLDTGAQDQSDTASDLPAGVDAFQEDSDRPYNKMVETLYNRAVEDYGKDQPDDALALLKKAQELDPIQPQVQSLLEKVRLSLSDSGYKAGLTNASSVDTDVEKDFQPANSPGSKNKTKLTKDESIASYFKTSETVKTPKKKKSGSKKQKTKNLVSLTSEGVQAESDQTYNLGLESYRSGNYADAKKYWEQTLVINPNHLQAKRNLSRLKAEHPDLP
jgi:tetratricopeptide (TPR) repeat protein